ncbi:S9 family peptidase [Aquisalibacillus elongatus]|uniref:Dipeptidyl aminopeptidase/acylaminoacyl peptidase n=1 Tax=Aquisalibacillus elongatus TaxID=485577 RepID=A0A3N5BED9_9BACI|nr:S9 family peptidase [Aquisalibacillus elongatus]RPF55833.1 dipeptidyl aminopeptidase/acylaminoacyl peptidase [Aquisalibacillus elongatus]
MSAKRLLKAEDIFQIDSVTDPRVAPNQKEAVFVKTHLDEKENKYVSNLFHLDLETKEVNQWTHQSERLSQPRWSPNGDQLLFLSNRNEKNQVFVISTKGGEAKKVTDEDESVSSASFSSDGQKVIYQVAKPLEQDEDKDNDEDEKDEKPKPTVINRMKYKADGAGVLKEKYQQIKLLDLENEEVEVLKEGNQNFIFQSWIDEKTLIYSTDEHANQDFNFNHNVYIYNIENKTTTEIPTDQGYASNFVVSPNGKHVLFVHMGQTYKNATHTEVIHFDLTTNVAMPLTTELDAPVGDFVVADTQQQADLQTVIWANNEDFYFPVSDQGSVQLYYGNLKGELYPAYNQKAHIYGLDLISENQALVAISTPTSPGELYNLDVTSGETEQLTHFNQSFLDEVTIVEPASISYKSKDDWTVHGWFMKPANYQEGQSYPLIVNIHGGPHAFYANTFFHEMQYFAANGYAVLYVNPRGSHSYGQEFVDAVRGDYGNGDYQDIINGLEYILDQNDWIDETRLGVTGGSYGGFMTNWIVGHTNRFKAAVTQRSISNWISFRGVSDIGYYFNDWQIQAELDEPEMLWKHSPIAYASQIETPLKIIHNERDFRCPMEQAEQLFIALKYNGTETEFVRFPEADHNLSRTGKPNLRIERLNHILGWFEDYLK